MPGTYPNISKTSTISGIINNFDDIIMLDFFITLNFSSFGFSTIFFNNLVRISKAVLY